MHESRLDEGKCPIEAPSGRKSAKLLLDSTHLSTNLPQTQSFLESSNMFHRLIWICSLIILSAFGASAQGTDSYELSSFSCDNEILFPKESQSVGLSSPALFLESDRNQFGIEDARLIRNFLCKTAPTCKSGYSPVCRSRLGNCCALWVCSVVNWS
jgi:hypothetical protein